MPGHRSPLLFFSPLLFGLFCKKRRKKNSGAELGLPGRAPRSRARPPAPRGVAGPVSAARQESGEETYFEWGGEGRAGGGGRAGRYQLQEMCLGSSRTGASPQVGALRFRAVQGAAARSPPRAAPAAGRPREASPGKQEPPEDPPGAVAADTSPAVSPQEGTAGAAPGKRPSPADGSPASSRPAAPGGPGAGGTLRARPGQRLRSRSGGSGGVSPARRQGGRRGTGRPGSGRAAGAGKPRPGMAGPVAGAERGVSGLCWQAGGAAPAYGWAPHHAGRAEDGGEFAERPGPCSSFLLPAG